MASSTMRGDAQLHDVCFVDAQQGWAVGDRGAIWHTEDGGRGWSLQASGAGCPLRSVCFVDQRTGWAVGGRARPYTHTGAGVVLLTRDGGRRWQEVPNLLLPALHSVRFFDHQRGWAMGCGSAMCPAGIFTTADGGRSWTPLVGGAPPGGWLAGDMLDPTSGVAVGRSGAAAQVLRGGIEPARMGDFGLRSIKQARLVPPVYGWLVGDGGLVAMTGDLGASWQTPPGPLPAAAAAHFDFAALAVRGPRAWVAGDPGSVVFFSPDAGHTWASYPTGSPLPIEALFFVDDQQGWAVGALGTILATDDGGRTWRRQRAGGSRAALMGLVSRVEDAPLELLARLSGNEGYLSVVEVLNRRDVEAASDEEVHAADRLHEAVVGVGGCAGQIAWRFPLRQDGLEIDARQILDVWDRTNDGRGAQELLACLVRQIRTWRPDVVVTHDACPSGDDPASHLINQLVLQAVEQAADPTRLTGQLTDAGLKPWEVKKVYAALPPPQRGTTDLATDQLATRLGRSLADLSAAPRGLLETRFRMVEPVLGFRLLLNRLPQDRGRSDFFSGMVHYPGGDARREMLQPPSGSLEMIRQVVQKRRNVQAILERTDEDPQAGAGLLGQVGDLTRGLDAHSAAMVLYQLADRYRRSGRWPEAAQALTLLADRYPEHPLARPALVWLVQYYAGAETAWRVEGAQRVTAGQTVTTGQPMAVRQVSELGIDLAQQEDRPARAAALGRQIEQALPDLFADPAIRFPLAVAQRNRGFPADAQRFFLVRGRSPVHDAWSICAAGEQWLADPRGLPPKPVLRCVRAAEKPRLDGRLDDAVWQRAETAALGSPQRDDAEWPAAAMLAYDAEFLYLAVKCRKAPGANYRAIAGPRPRDPDLSDRDRVDLLVDLDRDYATYYRLTIDRAGWVAESCWGDATWDPTWFAAAGGDGRTWTAEAAVPLDQLTGRYPAPRHVWAVGLQRVVPGVGFQSWSTPAAVAVRPEGFGYLIFE